MMRCLGYFIVLLMLFSCGQQGKKKDCESGRRTFDRLNGDALRPGADTSEINKAITFYEEIKDCLTENGDTFALQHLLNLKNDIIFNTSRFYSEGKMDSIAKGFILKKWTDKDTFFHVRTQEDLKTVGDVLLDLQITYIYRSRPVLNYVIEFPVSLYGKNIRHIGIRSGSGEKILLENVWVMDPTAMGIPLSGKAVKDAQHEKIFMQLKENDKLNIDLEDGDKKLIKTIEVGPDRVKKMQALIQLFQKMRTGKV